MVTLTNVSLIHLHALLGVGNFTKVVRDGRRFKKQCSIHCVTEERDELSNRLRPEVVEKGQRPCAH
jgi:hypothetical protein